MTSSSVSRIHIEYSDGSYDNIRLLQNGKYPIYDLNRQKENDAMTSLGAHSSGAIAALLFITAISNERTEYSPVDPMVGALINTWLLMTKDNR